MLMQLKAPLFDNKLVEGLVSQWQRARTPGQQHLWAQIVEQTTPLIRDIIRKEKLDLRIVGEPDEICSELVLKLPKVIAAYVPGKGQLFSLLQISFQRYLRNLLEKQYRYRLRYRVDSDFIEEYRPLGEPEVYSIAAEIRTRLIQFTSVHDDFILFIVNNLVVYAYTYGGGEDMPGGHPPIKRIAGMIARLTKISRASARARTVAAMESLREALKDLRGGTLEPNQPNHCNGQQSSALSPRLCAYRDELQHLLSARGLANRPGSDRR